MKQVIMDGSLCGGERFVEHQQFAYDRTMDAQLDGQPDIVRIAGAVGDATRIRMLSLLMEGRALTAKELALGAGVEPGTATSHLKRLLDDALVTSTSQGRHKYFRFANDDVAQLVETLMRVAPRKPVTPEVHEPIRAARYCYDHLAGGLGTGLFASMMKKGWIEGDPEDGGDAKQLLVTRKGEKALASLGVDVESARARRRQFACRCLDWSERQDHLGGALGAAIAEHFRAAKWIERQKHTRVVRVTPAGKESLLRLGVKA
jgi:DNA-binding transcriptional ArsR family regulator